MSDKELIKHCTESNALSYNELKEMDQDELDQVFSVCWKDAQYNGGYNIDSLRCYTKGIRYPTYDELSGILGWSDDDGDPDIDYKSPDEKIHYIDDGTWAYGIYKSKQQIRDNKLNKILNDNTTTITRRMG